jgi:RING finger protein 113A
MLVAVSVWRRHNAKTSKCAACEQPTQGVFNTAHEILKKMKKQQQGK